MLRHRVISLLLPAVVALALSPASGRAEEVLVIRSKNIGPYNLALEGFRKAYRGRFDTVLLEGDGSLNRGNAPDLVVAIGTRALKASLQLPRSVPILFLMSLNVDEDALRGRSYVGIDTTVRLGDYLEFIERHFPGLPRIGIITSRDEIVEQAGRYDGLIKVTTSPVSNLDQVPGRFRQLLEKIDALLLLPDRKVVSKETTKFMLLKSVESRKPIFAYSPALVKSGALLSLSAPYGAIGEQAAHIANQGAKVLDSLAEIRPPRHTSVKVNSTTAQRVGIRIPSQLHAQ